ncbi:MAG: CYTH domain-containing protein [Cyanobacteria bacterium J06638_7]
MALEIERRFLVVGEGWRRHVRWQEELQQGYLSGTAADCTVRVRLCRPAGTAEVDSAAIRRAWLTLKAPVPGDPAELGTAAGLVRHEFEYPIPADDAAALLALSTRLIHKRRHGLDLAGGDWVVDLFAGANAPLVVAEVELERADQPLALPDWCGLEVTTRHELSNAALAHNPFCSWPAQGRDGVLKALGSHLKIS